MKKLLLLLSVVIFVSCLKKEPIQINLESDIFTPQHYVVPRVDASLVIDGLANDLAWENAPFTELFIDIGGKKKPKYDTQVKMLWDNEYLYVYAHMKEQHIWGNLYQRDTVIFYNNDFEVFLDPDGDTYNYGEIEVNALNTVWDLKLDKPYRVSGKADNNWNLDQFKSAININGTLNDPADVDSFWTVEMAIPMDRIMELKNTDYKFPKSGDQWRVNFSRVNWDHDIVNGKYDRKKVDNKYLPEYNWVWSKQGVINMHEPEKWGFIQFTDKTVSDESEFVPDLDLSIKLTAYALFRHISYGSLKQLLSLDKGNTEEILAKISDDQSIKAVYTKTTKGFEVTLMHPQNDKVYSINEEGWLEIK